MTLDLAKIKSDAEIIASRCDTLLMPLPVKDVLGMLSELEKFDDGMRALAFQLSAGGYNAETLTADQLVSKVSDGLKAFADSTEVLVDGLRKDAERYRWLRDGGYLHSFVSIHPCDEHKASELTDQAVDRILEFRP